MKFIKTVYRFIRSTLRQLLFAIHQLYFSFASSKVECNICGYKANHLDSDGWHEHSVCPRCKSSMRQRLLWAALTLLNDVHKDKLIAGKKVLHFAPELGLSGLLGKAAAKYESADYFAEGYSYGHIDHNLDISDMKSIADNTYDCLIACDVLEHVPNHLNALAEINRVLKKGGYCILTVPQQDHLEKTVEDLSPMSNEERERKFGQWDHLRIYGSDFADMITAKGFEVRIVDEKDFASDVVAKYVLFPPVLSKHPMATNYRKIYFGKKS